MGQQTWRETTITEHEMLQPHGILEAALYVSDYGRAEKFYSRVLRLKRICKSVQPGLFYDCGNCVLLLFRAEDTAVQATPCPPHAADGTGHVAFRVHHQEISDWRAHLKSCGVEIETEIKWPRGGYSIYFRDPDGNSLELATTNVWPEPQIAVE
jgi:catechol 2,3-dioxygenase-like lactoylglutathione lyase family enzyme